MRNTNKSKLLTLYKNIFGDSEESAALLATSVLVGRNENYLIMFLDTFGNDFRKDGTWNDETTRYNVGTRFDYDVQIVERIHNNIMGWESGPVPKFGKYIKKKMIKQFLH